MSQNEEQPIIGYDQIAKAVTRAIKCSVSVRTAKRYAAQGRTNRLPVFVYPNGRAYLIPAHLALWAQAWLARKPSGARPPGKAKAA